MASPPDQIEKILQISHPVLDTACCQALGTADRATEKRLIEALMARNRPAGLRGLVQRFDRLAGESQRWLLDKTDLLAGAIRHAATEGDGDAQANAIEMVSRSGDCSLAYLLALQMSEGDGTHRRAAADGLLRMARRTVMSAEAGSDEPRRRYAQVLAAVAEACACFHQHRRRDVLLAAMCFLPVLDPRVRRHLTDRRASAYAVVGELLTLESNPLAARALLPMAGVDTMREPVERALGRPEAAQQVSAMLQLSHLLVAPAVRATVRGVERCEHLVVKRARLDEPTQRRMPRWLATLALDTPTRIRALSDIACSGDRFARLMCLRELMRSETEHADEAVGVMCFDADAAIARVAIRHLLRRRWAGLSRLMVRLVGSEHEQVRQLAEQQLAPVGFERYWANWSRMSREQRTSAGRALMKIDRNFLHKLLAKMNDPAGDHRHQAVQAARLLGQQTYFEDRLIELVADDDAKVAASAARALGRLGDSEQAMAALEHALDHDDDRVRSNAIESLQEAQRIALFGTHLERISGGAGNRSRATAIRALMQMPVAEGVPALERMLADRDDRHRTSALWVVEHLGLLGVVGQVAELAKADPDPRVRGRALRVVRQMAAEVKHGGAAQGVAT